MQFVTLMAEKNTLLDENYRRSLKSTLMVVEKLLVEMASLMSGGVHYRIQEVKHDIDPEIKSRNLQLIQQARKQIDALADKYEIKKDVKGLRQMVSVRKVKIWEVLSNSKVNKLRGFGKLNQNLGDEFDRDMESLLEITERIQL